MLYGSKVNALALRKQCFWHPKSNAFQARKLCFRKVEEEWKRTFSLPPPEPPLYKGFSEEEVEVEEKTLKKFLWMSRSAPMILFPLHYESEANAVYFTVQREK